jgi:3-oxoacyl-[acyl-carrier protein] reductase
MDASEGSREMLSGTVALVTGGNTGIGAAIARRLASDGARVIINYCEHRELASSLVKIIKNDGGCAVCIRADVTKAAHVSRMFRKIHETYGLVEVLINNAGIYPRCDWNDLEPKVWSSVIDANLGSTYLCSRHASADMRILGRGRIINISSNLVRTGKKQLAHYIAAKAGVVGLTRALAVELGEFGINVNCILAGSIEVDRERIVIEDYIAASQRVIARQCIKRRGSPFDIAHLCSFLASKESGFITGQCVGADGGIAFL